MIGELISLYLCIGVMLAAWYAAVSDPLVYPRMWAIMLFWPLLALISAVMGVRQYWEELQ